MGYKSPAELLPMLLQQPKGKNKGHVYGAGRRPLLVALLMPAETLAARAGFVQQQLGLSREQVCTTITTTWPSSGYAVLPSGAE